MDLPLCWALFAIKACFEYLLDVFVNVKEFMKLVNKTSSLKIKPNQKFFHCQFMSVLHIYIFI